MATKEENMLKFIIVEKNFKGHFYLYSKIDLICYQDVDGLYQFQMWTQFLKAFHRWTGPPNGKEIAVILLSCKSRLTLRAFLHM